MSKNFVTVVSFILSKIQLMGYFENELLRREKLLFSFCRRRLLLQSQFVFHGSIQRKVYEGGIA